MRTRLLPAIFEKQGDFGKMQGSAGRKLAKRQRFSIAWKALSLLKGAGRSREANLALQGSLPEMIELNPHTLRRANICRLSHKTAILIVGAISVLRRAQENPGKY